MARPVLATPSSSNGKNMIRIEPYQPSFKSLWNEFVTQSKNGLFLFDRDYMEYHADRFTDSSLMFYNDADLVAVMPANRKGDTLVSHGGLTFGGIVSDTRMRAPLMMEIFETLHRELPGWGIKSLTYKAIPHIYHTVPAEEDLYALFRNDAQLYRRDVSSTIDNRARVAFSTLRKRGAKQAQKNGLVVKESNDFETFMQIEEQVLSTRHGVKAVHTAMELRTLANRFPENVQLYAAYREGTMLGGVVIYASRNVAHAQYISASDEGKKASALDLILDWLINERYADKNYFDFGISTESEGRYLNLGLIGNKEGFGARATVHDFYRLEF